MIDLWLLKISQNCKWEIIYHRVGAYSMTFGGMFIRYYPNVFVEKENGIERVRTAISTEEYVEIHS